MRYLIEFIKKDLDKKVVLLSGPRQVGKTWLSNKLFPREQTVYLNFDRTSDRRFIREELWDRRAELVVFDEIHKMKGWKNWLKGIFDTDGTRPRLLATGSARFDVFRRGGRESLAGRHHSYRLHPFSITELKNQMTPEEAMAALMQRGGFPEPLFADSLIDVQRWRMSHLDSILREDLRDLVVIQDIKSIEYLVDRLAAQVGSPISYQSLAEDVGVSAPTIKRWIQTLEAMFIIAIIYPWTKKIRGSILKQPKIYFYDTARIPEQYESARFENLVGMSLLKHIHFLEDSKGIKGGLFYLRDKKKREIDFLVTRNAVPEWLIECKQGEAEHADPSVFQEIKPRSGCYVLSQKNIRTESRGRWTCTNAAPWLSQLSA